MVEIPRQLLERTSWLLCSSSIPHGSIGRCREVVTRSVLLELFVPFHDLLPVNVYTPPSFFGSAYSIGASGCVEGTDLLSLEDLLDRLLAFFVGFS
jgi:hypothetical protein